MKKVKDWSQILLFFVTIVLLATNVFLIIQNSNLKKSVEQYKLFIPDEGYSLTDLKLQGLGGNEETINLSDGQHKTLLLVFKTSCEYCKQQYPYWKELTENLDPSLWRILAVTTENNYDNIKTHLEENKLINIKVAIIPQEEAQKGRLGFTPMTLVVDTNGEVKKIWAGLWKSKNLDNF